MDWETGSCDFDNAEFVSILEAASRVKSDRSKEFEQPGQFENTWSRLARGQVLMMRMSRGGGTSLAFDADYSGKEVCYFSLPTVDGEELLRVQLELAAGIFAGSEQKEGCWEFIRFTLMDPTANMHISSRPLYRPLFDEMLEANVGDYPNQISIEEAAELRELVERADKLAIYDDSAMDIILEEAGAYFAGAQSAEQTAKYVQNRLSIYIAEQS